MPFPSCPELTLASKLSSSKCLPLLTIKSPLTAPCGLFGSEEKLVDCSGRIFVAVKGGHSSLDPFSLWLWFLFPPMSFSTSPWVTHCLLCTSTSLGQCFPFEHCQALFLGSSFAPTPPRAESPGQGGVSAQKSSEEAIQLFGVACLWEAQVTYQKAEAVW